ncbi:MAG: NUDIX domain-containing protein, partial [Firmicutes bacterium]|nr:NUDIX domain-containing protein [Bacillota bacterium]
MTVRLRQMTCAFLEQGSDLLLMKRSDTMYIAPGLWAGIGGHLEPHEVRDPLACVLREIAEETGMNPQQIRDLRLHSIVSRLRGQ